MAWFEEEAFWRGLYPYMFPAERFAAAERQVEQIVALTGIKAGRILDLCCGPGRHAIEFARRGFDVTGVDRSDFLLERAAERANGAGVPVKWVNADMRRYRSSQAFDLACNLFTSFGYFENEADNLRVLRNTCKNLAPGGILFMEMLGKERLAYVWKHVMTAEYADGAMLVQRPEVRADWSRLHNFWTLMKDGAYKTYEFEHSIYSGRELKHMLLAAGFAEVQLFGSYDGAPYGLDALRLIAIARKKQDRRFRPETV